MKLVSWNVRGAYSPHKKYILWKTLFDKESGRYVQNIA